MGVSATYEYDPSEHYRAMRAVTSLTPFRWVGRVCFVLLPAGMLALAALGAHATGHGVATAVLGVLPYVLLCFFWGALIPMSSGGARSGSRSWTRACGGCRSGRWTGRGTTPGATASPSTSRGMP